MTREEKEAVKILKGLSDEALYYADDYKEEGEKERKALAMAIEAISQKPCEDCISREQVRESICKACSIEEDYHKCNGYYDADSDWCEYMVALREIPSIKPVQNWTPCSEGLPKANGRYFVTLHIYGELDFKVDETVVKIIPFFDKWRVPTHIPEWINEALTQEVLAWMPLPKEYKESE